jgi:DNA-binding transcriptional MocR family regulator
MATLPPINFTRGVPATESFPLAELTDAAMAAFQHHGAALQYGPALGFAPLREWIAQWQGVHPQQVLTGNGSLELLEFLCRLLLQPGDVVFTEAPTYDRTLTLLRRHRATVVGIPLEPDGPQLSAVERALQSCTPKFFYLIPDFQNPAGATCAGAKRRRLVALAEQYDFTLVEDAPYRFLRYRGTEEPTLFMLAPHRTLHLSSFTKLLGPGVRLGFLLGNAEVLSRLSKVAEDTYISPGYVAHGIAYEWCRHGLLPPQIVRLKALYAPRLEACRAALATYLPEAQATRPEGGFFVSVTLPQGIRSAAVRTAAANRGLHLADGEAFFPHGGGEHFLRLPFCALSPVEIDEGIQRLAAAVAEVRAK